MELRDYKDMYDKMSMSNEMDERIRNAVLGRQERKDIDMKKHNFKKVAVAVVLCGLALAGGVSTYAGSWNLSILPMFSYNGKDVKEKAISLIDTEVSQEKGTNKKQAEFATFEVVEAVCDKNHIIAEVEVKAADKDKYLLIPYDCDTKRVLAKELNFMGVGDDFDGDLTVEEYAKSLGKKCLRVDVSICDEINMIEDYDDWSGVNFINSCSRTDGTRSYSMFLKNTEKKEKLDFVCETAVYPDENDCSGVLKNKIKFTLTDKTGLQVIKYKITSNKKIAGTDLVVDEVYFEKSDLSLVCNVKYHYTGKKKDWKDTKGVGLRFYMVKENGDKFAIKSFNCEPEFDGNTAIGSVFYGVDEELPDTITFEARDGYFEGESYGTFEAKLVK